jgi:4-amino-4-deoxy-L-arabinose transferase-like glycosyltransferase
VGVQAEVGYYVMKQKYIVITGNSIKKRLVLVLLAAILVRFGFIIWDWSGYHIRPQWTLSMRYFKEGYGIAAGYGYVYGGEGAARQHLRNLYRRVRLENIRVTPEMAGPMPEEGKYFETLHPPGMALLVAGINRLFGIRADLPVQFIGLILDSAAAVLVCWIVSSFLTARIGLIAGLAYAFYLPLAYASSVSKLPGGLLTFFIVAMLACVLQATRSRGWHVAGWYLLSGVILGIGCYLRPDYMLLPVFMAFPLWAYTRRFICSMATMIVVQTVVLLVLFPWAYRNHNLCGRWIFTSTSVGGTLITGLGEFNNPWGFGYLDKDRHEQAVSQGFVNAWVPEADTYFKSLFIQSIKEKPGAYLKAIILRLPMAFLTPHDWGYNNPFKTGSFAKDREAGEDRYQVLKSKAWYFFTAYWDRLVMGGISFLCLMGVFVLLVKEHRRFGLVLLLICPHVYSISTHILTHFETRFILPSMFCWLIGLSYLLDIAFHKKDAQPTFSSSHSQKMQPRFLI